MVVRGAGELLAGGDGQLARAVGRRRLRCRQFRAAALGQRERPLTLGRQSLGQAQISAGRFVRHNGHSKAQ